MHLPFVPSFFTTATPIAAAPAAAGKYKAMFGKPGWPEITKWNKLESQVGENLISVVPPGAYCRSTFQGEQIFNATKCSAYGAGIRTQQFRYPLNSLSWREITDLAVALMTRSTCYIHGFPIRVCLVQT